MNRSHLKGVRLEDLPEVKFTPKLIWGFFLTFIIALGAVVVFKYSSALPAGPVQSLVNLMLVITAGGSLFVAGLLKAANSITDKKAAALAGGEIELRSLKFVEEASLAKIPAGVLQSTSSRMRKVASKRLFDSIPEEVSAKAFKANVEQLLTTDYLEQHSNVSLLRFKQTASDEKLVSSWVGRRDALLKPKVSVKPVQEPVKVVDTSHIDNLRRRHSQIITGIESLLEFSPIETRSSILRSVERYKSQFTFNARDAQSLAKEDPEGEAYLSKVKELEDSCAKVEGILRTLTEREAANSFTDDAVNATRFFMSQK